MVICKWECFFVLPSEVSNIQYKHILFAQRECSYFKKQNGSGQSHVTSENYETFGQVGPGPQKADEQLAGLAKRRGGSGCS